MKTETGVILAGVALIVGAFVLASKKEAPGPAVPVPYDPEGIQLGRGEHFSYKGVYISVVPAENFSSEWTWTMRGAPSLQTAPLAISQARFALKEAALSDAMRARDVQLGGAS